MRPSKILASALLASLLLPASPSLAEGNCPGGMYPINGIGFQSCAPIPGYEDQGYGGDQGYSDPVGADGLASLFGLLADAIHKGGVALRKGVERKKLPKGVTSIHESAEGIWLLFKVDGACSVAFKQGGQTLIFAGPSRTRPGAITFLGPGIPSPSSPAETEVTLLADGKPAKVSALHLASGGQGALIVPTVITDTLASIGDSEEVGVKLRGRRVFSIETHGAHKARKALLKCLK